MPAFPILRTVLVATLFSFPALATGAAKEADEDPAVLADQEEPTVAPEKAPAAPQAKGLDGSHQAKDAAPARAKKTHKAKATHKAHKAKTSKAKPTKVATDKPKAKDKRKKPVAQKAKPKPKKPTAVKVKHTKSVKSAKHSKHATVPASHKPAEKPIDIVQ